MSRNVYNPLLKFSVCIEIFKYEFISISLSIHFFFLFKINDSWLMICARDFFEIIKIHSNVSIWFHNCDLKQFFFVGFYIFWNISKDCFYIYIDFYYKYMIYCSEQLGDHSFKKSINGPRYYQWYLIGYWSEIMTSFSVPLERVYKVPEKTLRNSKKYDNPFKTSLDL